jgi:hypothetical protein
MAAPIKKVAAKKTAVKKTAAPRRATDKRVTGTAKNPTKVTAPSAAAYKAPKTTPVVKGKAGRPKKVS